MLISFYRFLWKSGTSFKCTGFTTFHFGLSNIASSKSWNAYV